MANRYLLGVPTGKGIVVAFLAILAFLGLAFWLYGVAGKHTEDFLVKVADYLLQGALISLMFAILKTIIDETKI